LFTSKVTRVVVKNGAKVMQLGDRVDSLTSALMGILVENTNDRSMLSLDKPCNSTDGYLRKGIIRNASDVSSKEGFRKNNNIRTTETTISPTINEGDTRPL
jgi:hypothetical protein